jgi:hypothetical protein
VESQPIPVPDPVQVPAPELLFSSSDLRICVLPEPILDPEPVLDQYPVLDLEPNPEISQRQKFTVSLTDC